MSDIPQSLQDSLADRYRIERELGRGGMATVYLAEDLRHHRSVAIKVLTPEIATLLGPQRFLQEIEVAGRLTHPLILPLYDSGAAGGLLYYVMPYIKGESLRARLEREKQLPLEDALRITREVADALSHAHHEGLVHRDIKPENILLSSSHALVADFGVARAIGEAGDTRLTASGIALGTPLYMSPEQSLSSRDADARTDIYSLGCVLYEMLSGAPPFTGVTAQAVQARHAIDPVPPLRTLRPGISESVEHAISKALAKVPADRFATAEQLAQALELSPPPLPRPRIAWGRIVTFSGAVILVGLVAVAAWQKWGPFSPSRDSPNRAPALKKDWILVADFDGPPGDSSLAVTTRELVSAALDQSAIVSTVPREQIRLALEKAGKPTNSRVDPELAHELAYRSAVRAVLGGKVGRLGRGYSVVLRVVDADSAKLILTASAVANNEDALIPALGQLAKKLRAGLGEQRNAIKATRELADVATPSFEAYRLYVQAHDKWTSGSGAQQEAIPVFRDALALDPDLAMAWQFLGTIFSNLGQGDSAVANWDEALRRPQRLTTGQRLNTEALRLSANGDLRGALDAFDRAVQYDATNTPVLNNRGLMLGALVRFEEALESERRAERAYPFAVAFSTTGNEARFLSSLGRVDEARAVARHLPGSQRRLVFILVEITANNWAAAESIADTLVADPGLDEDRRAEALLILASAHAARGALRAAVATFERAEEVAHGAVAPLWYQDPARRGRLMLTVASERALPLPADTWAHDSSTATLITRGLRAAIVGDRAGAQHLSEVVRTRSRRE